MQPSEIKSIYNKFFSIFFYKTLNIVFITYLHDGRGQANGKRIATVDSRKVGGILDDHLENFVTFTVGDQMFGTPILMVQDILMLEKLNPFHWRHQKPQAQLTFVGALLGLSIFGSGWACQNKNKTTQIGK